MRGRKPKPESRATEFRARTNAENRPMTQWEDQQARAYDRAAVSITAGYMLLDDIKRMAKEP
jgi:hypothetical protein